MARQKSHQVREPKKDKRLSAGVITSEDMRAMRKSGRRQALKEAGMLSRNSGTVFHEDARIKAAKKDRRDWKQRVNRGDI